MPRTALLSQQQIIERALPVFWRQGFGASSMDDLVSATGASRHAIYTGFGSKTGLFLACLDNYRDAVVTPVFAQVEADGATLASAAAYFETLIGLSEQFGLPGPGCLMVNTTTELAAHDPAVAERMRAHQARLSAGFANAIRGETCCGAPNLLAPPAARVRSLAALMAVSAQGLWAVSRAADDAAMLRDVARGLIAMVRAELARSADSD